MDRGRGGYFQNYRKTKPSFTVPGNNVSVNNQMQTGNQNEDQNELQHIVSEITFSTQVEQGSYIGWKHYFPRRSFKDSHDLVRRVKAIEHHIKKYIHWYDIFEIEQKHQFPLILKNLEEDEELFDVTWPTLKEDLILKATETFACMGLAMHNVIISVMTNDNERDDRKIESFQDQKIYTRPIGFESTTEFSDACHSGGQLITVSGTVIAVDPLQINCKKLCYLCSSCSTKFVVQQNPKSLQPVYPTSCQGCSARGTRFVHQFSSPYTIFQPKQMMKLKGSICHINEAFNYLYVELSQYHVDTIIPGIVVKVTGVIRHCQDKSKKFVKKGESVPIQTYLKCFNVEIINQFESRLKEPTIANDLTAINKISSEPSPFRLLVQSLCPSIHGREEIKAGLILSLLSGDGLMKERRSESHVLMIGNPGTGKSKLLKACAELSAKGIYVNGPTSTAVGLTASVGHNGSVKAGALMLADGGICCIDEFDKMLCHTDVFLETMEQQEITITKCGIKINAPSRVVIIAAANPIGSFYDHSKTFIKNVKISIPLMTRFDLIFKLTELERSSDDAFNEDSRSRSNSNAQIPPLDVLPTNLLQCYIEHARKKIQPVLSKEAQEEVLTFFQTLQNSCLNNEMPITIRQLEGIVRLTLSRARADLVEVATLQHAIDVINLVKFSSAIDSRMQQKSTRKRPKSSNANDEKQQKISKFFKRKL